MDTNSGILFLSPTLFLFIRLEGPETFDIERTIISLFLVNIFESPQVIHPVHQVVAQPVVHAAPAVVAQPVVHAAPAVTLAHAPVSIGHGWGGW